MHVFPKLDSSKHVCKGGEPRKKKERKKSLTSKPKTFLTISNRNAFSKATRKLTFLGEFYQNALDNDAHLETFLKDSNKDVIQVSQIISYTKCRLSHCTTIWFVVSF